MTQPNYSPDAAPSSSCDPAELVERTTLAHHQSTGPLTRLSRAWNILKYYRKSQLAIRALRLVIGKRRQQTFLNKVGLESALETRSVSEFSELARIRIQNHYRNSKEVRRELTHGRVRVLNQTFPLDWHHGGEGSLLWQFQLHYHEYLLPLLNENQSVGSEKDRGLIQEIISSWMEESPFDNSKCHVAAWHPYCISRRLPVWFCILSTNSLSDGMRQKAIASAYHQASYLASNLEWDLRGNHLLENLKALALAGAFFEDGKQWLDQVRKLLPLQLKEQVLPWGEHFERCPMYHCQILGNLLETIIVCRKVDESLVETIRPIAQQMLSFLKRIIHPDGEIPLLGDSCFGEAPSVECLGALATSAGLELPTESINPEVQPQAIGPYWINREQDDFLIFDRGNVGAETLPAHAHCDLLTIEASVRGRRLIVDSGLYNYEEDPMRWHCRSSLAHNVVVAGDTNQCDIWSKFRMGYRGWPSNLDNGTVDGFHWASGSHNGYRRLGIPNITRLIGVHPSKFWYCLDFVPATNGKKLSGLIHFSPETEVFEESDGRFRIKIDENSFDLSFFGVSKVKTTTGWYCPEFGLRQKNTVLEYSFAKQSSAIAGWLFDFDLSKKLAIDVQKNVSSDLEAFQIFVSSNDQEQHKFQWKLTQ